MSKLQDALERVTGESWTLRLELEAGPSAGELEIAPAEAIPLAPPPSESAHPLVDAVISTLEARLLRVDPGFGSATRPAGRDDSTDETPIPEWDVGEDD